MSHGLFKAKAVLNEITSEQIVKVTLTAAVNSPLSLRVAYYSVIWAAWLETWETKGADGKQKIIEASQGKRGGKFLFA